MPTTSPNMGLVVPVASTGASGTGDVGPGYAQNISTDLLTNIDAHDHSFGKGVQVTPAGLSINADLPFGNNNATTLRAVRFTSQASGLVGVGDIDEIYVKSGDLWYVNAAGQQVQVTAGSALGTGPAGPTGSAGTSFVSNYFQAGVTGVTGCALAGGQAVPFQAMIQWNQPLLQAGTVTQPTGQGTGSAWIQVANAGLYEVSYQFGFTGVTPACPVTAYQQINATGANAGGAPNGGSGIAASMQYQQIGIATGVGSVSGRYIVQLQAGAVVTSWVSVPTALTPTSHVLNPTGTLFSMKQIG